MSYEISELYTYPIKSCAAIRHEAITLGARGPRYDRHWMLIEAGGKASGLFLSGRDVPRMVLIQPQLGAETMTVTAPGMSTLTVPLEQAVRGRRRQVTIWNDTCMAVDEGDQAAEWMSAFLERQVRLVSIADDFSRIVDTEYVERPSETGFSDAYPLMVISEESLADLNQHLSAQGEAPVAMERFRTNVVVRGGAPFDEDTWRHIHMGGVAFEVVKPCKRCQMVTIDYRTGTTPNPKQPTAALATYRRWNGGVIFGQNVVHRGMGTLQVGDAVTVNVAADHWITSQDQD